MNLQKICQPDSCLFLSVDIHFCAIFHVGYEELSELYFLEILPAVEAFLD
jgi:hypothetical protein